MIACLTGIQESAIRWHCSRPTGRLFGPDRSWLEGRIWRISVAAAEDFVTWQNDPKTVARRPGPKPGGKGPGPAPDRSTPDMSDGSR